MRLTFPLDRSALGARTVQQQLDGSVISREPCASTWNRTCRMHSMELVAELKMCVLYIAGSNHAFAWLIR
jgi:hypothetical protein